MNRIDPCASFGREVSEMRMQTVENQLAVTVCLEQAGGQSGLRSGFCWLASTLVLQALAET
jgi:hypothetical protein